MEVSGHVLLEIISGKLPGQTEKIRGQPISLDDVTIEIWTGHRPNTNLEC